MSRPTKSKKDKVPKITEAQYAEYISALKTLGEPPKCADKSAEEGNPLQKNE